MIKFLKELEKKERFYFFICWVLSFIIWCIINALSSYFLPKWIDLLVGIPLAFVLIIYFSRYYWYLLRRYQKQN